MKWKQPNNFTTEENLCESVLLKVPKLDFICFDDFGLARFCEGLCKARERRGIVQSEVGCSGDCVSENKIMTLKSINLQ